MSDPFGSDGGPLPNPYATAAESSLDGISVAALACSLTCCAAPVGIGLGIAGIVRTAAGRRTGRWMAVAGLVLGVVGSITLVVGGAALVRWVDEQDVDDEQAAAEHLRIDQLKAGDCVGMAIEDYRYIDITAASCTEPHEAEIVYASRFTSEEQVRAQLDDPTFCWPLSKTQGYTTLLDDGEYGYDIVVDSADSGRPEVGDAFACFVRTIDQAPMDTPLPRGEPEPAPELTGPTRVSSLELDLGDCFDEPAGGAVDLVDDVIIKECDRPHAYEVIGLVPIVAKAYPGDRAIARRSGACLARFADYLDIAYDDSLFELSYYSPTRASWRHDDDRTITCLGLHPQERKLKRSLEGIGR